MNDSAAISADEARQRLIEGNQRFLRGESRLSGVPRESIADLARGQSPFATILGCSDSRVSPERIFDAELGELFVVRVAGNILGPAVAGSLQYAGAHLHTPLFLVLGHEGCGAVQAALAAKHEGVQQRSRIQLLVDDIIPALDGLDSNLTGAAVMAQAVEANVRWTVRAILESPEGKAREAEGGIEVLGAIYDIGTGEVRFLTP